MSDVMCDRDFYLQLPDAILDVDDNFSWPSTKAIVGMSLMVLFCVSQIFLKRMVDYSKNLKDSSVTTLMPD